MNISIVSANGHRINEYFADRVQDAVEVLVETTPKILSVNRKVTKMTDLIIMTNGVGLSEEGYNAIATGIPILYLHDELQAMVPMFKHVLVASQYAGFGHRFFPVSSLTIFDRRLHSPLTNTEEFDFVYWGHPKFGRATLYNRMPDSPTSLYIGEWEELKPNSTVVPYIRDHDTLLRQIARGKRTITLGGEIEQRKRNVPFRLFEALMAGVQQIDGICYERAFRRYAPNKYELIQDLSMLMVEAYHAGR